MNFGTRYLPHLEQNPEHLYFYSLSELPENCVPLAKRSDVVDQVLAIALHPASDCNVTIECAGFVMNLAQSSDAHPFLVRTEVAEDMLRMNKKCQDQGEVQAAVGTLQ